MNSKKSKRKFSKNTGHNKLNSSPRPMRGGTRL